MYKFDQKKFLQAGRDVYGLRGKIERVADEVCEKGFDNIVLTGVGGTAAELNVVGKMFEAYSDLDVRVLNAAEAVVTQSKYITERTLVISASKSGDTKETVAVCGFAKDVGAQVVVFIAGSKGPLSFIATHAIINDGEGPENAMMKFYLLAGRIMFNRGYFKDYPQFAAELKYLHEEMLACKQAFEPTADELAKKYYAEPYQLWIASDINDGMIYMFTMCILEEMQWMRTKYVTSPEFFHGTLELVDKDVPVFLVKGEGPCRVLDERVERFLKDRTGKLYVFDLADYPYAHISDRFRYLISPILLASLTWGRYCYHLEKYSGHDLNFRRYYRKFEY